MVMGTGYSFVHCNSSCKNGYSNVVILMTFREEITQEDECLRQPDMQYNELLSLFYPCTCCLTTLWWTKRFHINSTTAQAKTIHNSHPYHPVDVHTSLAVMELSRCVVHGFAANVQEARL
jgi:hypothetical protein